MLQFNTHRPYSEAGQIIIARQSGDDIHFIDTTRKIYGLIKSTPISQNAIMSAYDAGRYDYLSSQDRYALEGMVK